MNHREVVDALHLAQRAFRTGLRAISAWGFSNQLDMLWEESNELGVAIAHYKRKRVDADKLAEEIADVLIVAAQITIVVGPRRVLNQVKAKLERLEHRLDRIGEAAQ